MEQQSEMIKDVNKKPQLILLVGTFGAGKTWVCKRLDQDKFFVIEQDSSRLWLTTLISAPRDKTLVCSLSILVKKNLKILRDLFEVQLVLVHPDLSELANNLRSRGSELTSSVIQRYRHFFKLLSSAIFYGSSQQVLDWICANPVKQILTQDGAGIYVIQNLLNGKVYVGSTRNLRDRMVVHFYNLRHGDHHSPHLQAAYSKYGLSAFRVTLIESIQDPIPTTLEIREQFYIDLFKSANPRYGYNISKFARAGVGNQSALGNHFSHTEQAKESIRVSRLGKEMSDETTIKVRQNTVDQWKERKESGASWLGDKKPGVPIGNVPWNVSKPKDFETRTCNQCKISIQVLKTSKTKFCGKDCYHQYQRENLGRITGEREIFVSKTCLSCGILFRTQKSAKHVYCSHICYSKHKSVLVPMTTRQCKQCSVEFQISTARLQHVKGEFCSKSCASKHRFLPKSPV